MTLAAVSRKHHVCSAAALHSQPPDCICDACQQPVAADEPRHRCAATPACDDVHLCVGCVTSGSSSGGAGEGPRRRRLDYGHGAASGHCCCPVCGDAVQLYQDAASSFLLRARVFVEAFVDGRRATDNSDGGAGGASAQQQGGRQEEQSGLEAGGGGADRLSMSPMGVVVHPRTLVLRALRAYSGRPLLGELVYSHHRHPRSGGGSGCGGELAGEQQQQMGTAGHRAATAAPAVLGGPAPATDGDDAVDDSGPAAACQAACEAAPVAPEHAAAASPPAALLLPAPSVRWFSYAQCGAAAQQVASTLRRQLSGELRYAAGGGGVSYAVVLCAPNGVGWLLADWGCVLGGLPTIAADAGAPPAAALAAALAAAACAPGGGLRLGAAVVAEAALGEWRQACAEADDSQSGALGLGRLPLLSTEEIRRMLPGPGLGPSQRRQRGGSNGHHGVEGGAAAAADCGAGEDHPDRHARDRADAQEPSPSPSSSSLITCISSFGSTGAPKPLWFGACVPTRGVASPHVYMAISVT
jgi:hypothetical protein